MNSIKNNKLELANINNTSDKIQNLVDLIKNYLSGEEINLYQEVNDLNIDISFEKKFSTVFAQKVMKFLIENIQYGETTTYSDIGEAIGTKAFRAIGNVMKSNPLPLIIPCHRVIRKNGGLGGFMGKMDKVWQTDLKLNLLKLEGSM
ncbi:MAG: methylated-DNA--[protein]-cysteine S-methyltransferase [Promethearchaeota archaeon]